MTPTLPSAVPRLLGVHPLLALAALVLCAGAAQAQAPAPTGLLNDTGQTQCYNATHAAGACDAATTGDAGARPRQDGRFGRDVASPTKVGGGAAGFDFTRICWNGDAEGSGTCTGTLVSNGTGTATGTPSTDWACTKDNVTNLIWSLQTQSATWNAASAPTYPDAGHNTANRCGYSTGWRLPTRRELLSIVHRGTINPAIDGSYFPATVTNWYWTSDTYAPNPSSAWIVYFYYGDTYANYKAGTLFVRLVRSGQ